MRIFFKISFFFLSFCAWSQVGINTTSPNAQLEIKSSNESNPTSTDGILIPKVDVFPATNPGASQQGMMVYLNITSGSNPPGFYYWDNLTASWIPVKGTDGGTLDQAYDFGGPGVGRVINADAQNVEINGEFGLSINKNLGSSANALQITHNSSMSNATTINLSSIFTTTTANTAVRGILNDIGGQIPLGSNFYAIQNNFSAISTANTGQIRAISNIMNNPNFSAIDVAVENRFSNNGNGTRHGISNIFARTGSGTDVGLYNNFNSTNAVSVFGIRNNFYENATGFFYGVYNSILPTNSSTSTKYGVFNTFPAAAGGLKYGVYSDVRGATDYSGYFLGRVAIGSSTANTYILPLSRGTNGQVIQTDGAGNTSWVNSTNFAWGLNGNAGTNPNINFIGTNDNTDIVFRRNSETIGRLRYNNISFGRNSLTNLTTGSVNIALGSNALNALTTGSNNIAIGSSTLENNLTGNGNIAIVGNALRDLQSGIGNIALGNQALQNAVNSNGAIAIGSQALMLLNSTISSTRNIAIGQESLYSNQGVRNVSLGYQAGYGNIEGNNNTFIGTNANALNSNLNYAVAIGSGAVVERSNAIALGGNTPINSTRVGINASNPLFSLHINQIGSVGLGLSNGTNSWEFWNNNTLRMYYNGIQRGNFNETNGVYTSISDRKLKTNIQPLEGILSKLTKLKPSSYTFKHDNNNTKQIGLIAQEVENIFPEFVYRSTSNERQEEDVYTLDYSGMSVIAIKAIQEQQLIIEKLQAEIERLKQLEVQVQQLIQRIETLEKK